MITPGMTGRPGKCPAKNHSSARTVLRATTRTPGLELEHLVHEEKRVPVRDDRLDLLPAEGCLQGESVTADLVVGASRGRVLAPSRRLPLLRGRLGREPYVFARALRRRRSGCSPGTPEGAVAVADEQTQGRGRMGRMWVAPPGTSLLSRSRCGRAVTRSACPSSSLVAGAAVAAAIGAAPASSRR